MGRALLLAATLALALAGCGGAGGNLTAESSCEDYVSASRDAQLAAVQKAAQGERVPYSVLVQNNVDAKCSVRPKQSIAFAVAGPGHGTNDVTHKPAATSKPLTINSTCQQYIDAAPDRRQAFIHKTADRFDRHPDFPNYDAWQEFSDRMCSDSRASNVKYRVLVMQSLGAVDPDKWDHDKAQPVR